MGPDAVAILLGATPATRSADSDYRFRQDSDFWYLTGFPQPNAIAVLRTDGGPEFTLYVEPRDREAEQWTGYRPGIEGAVGDFAADEAFARDKFLGDLGRIVGTARRVYHILGRDAAVDAAIVETLDRMRLRSRQGAVPAEAIFDPRAILHEMRMHKEPSELDIMRRASAISHEAHVAGASLAHEGAWEYELEAAIEHVFRRRGAAGPAYPTIVGGGANAAVLHYIVNDQLLRDGELVLVDAGCELEGYASDVTRTYPVGGHFVGERRAVYETVLAAQQAAFDLCKPGSTLVDVHQAAVHRLTEGLIDMQLLSGRVEDAVANEDYRRFYMHNTSHWLGLDVHDAGTYRVDGEHRTLEAGVVFTVEPGLYISPDDEVVPSGFRGIGVRIEDDVVVTTDGYENLTAALPRKPEEIEALVKGA
ncbi:MAG: aminopeptidase P N-terminal domain-containing protein [Deltaproteobacteria bacterium]|nr:aminopeptidase P N-terminal domain-containing protein [Deltaproteobacteria bacterium]